MKKPFLLLTAALASIAFPAFGASQLELITINTSSLAASTTGYLDFLFNGGGTPFQSATASITNFTANGSLNAASRSTSGTVTGTLPASVSIANNNAEYLEGFTFGSSVVFDLQFSGPAIDTPNSSGSGSVFTLSLLNLTQDGAYLTSDVNDGYLLSFNINSSGQVTSTTYSTSTGAPSVVLITSGTPEPGSAALAISGAAFAFGGLLLRRKRELGRKFSSWTFDRFAHGSGSTVSKLLAKVIV